MKTRVALPVNHPADHTVRWVIITGNDSELKRSGYVAGAEARKIAKTMAPGTHAYRITSGWTLGPDHFEARHLYGFGTE